jgi:Ca-activated chloride channel homolog
MTDDLDRLTAALRATPAPDADARQRAIAAAMNSFDQFQGTGAHARQTQDRPQRAGILRSALNMIDRLTTRQMLAGTASAAVMALAVVAVLPTLQTPQPATVSLPGELDTGRSAAVAETAPDAGQPEGLAEALPDDVAPGEPDVSAAIAAAEEAEVPAPATPAPQVDVMAEAPAMTAEEPPIAAPAVVPTDSAATEATMAPAPEQDTEVAEAAPPPAARAPAASRPRSRPRLIARSQPLENGNVEGPAQTAPEFAYVDPRPLPDTEAFANAEANPIKVTTEQPVSTFSIDVDTASYAVLRQSLMAGRLPPAEAVRIEEMVNYFPYAYPVPDGDQPFATTVSVMPTPWNPGTRLVRIGLQGQVPAIADRPALNLVFLIDTSGSMDEPAKLPLLKQSLALMLGELRPTDEVAIVAYAGSAGLVLPATAGTDTAAIMGALDRLAAGGSTAGAEGLALAYQTAAAMAGDDEVSRVLLATDGDFNVGLSDPDALKTYVAQQRDSGVYLSVLGFGRGNLDDATMQALAQNGNGQAAYIDTLNEARKVLVDQLTGALFPIANDVKVQVEWNPAQVAEYRLIGYETRALAREDFNNDRVDAGEIGAGLQVTALYEVTAPGSSALRNDPLRYGTAEAAP